MVAVHPLSGVTDPTAFDLSTGRLCVMTSRHRVGLFLVTRDHVGDAAPSRTVPGARRIWPDEPEFALAARYETDARSAIAGVSSPISPIEVT